jgi:hypothetical protein
VERARATGKDRARGRPGAPGHQGPSTYLVAGLLDATTCQPINPAATTYSGALVTIGGDAPYCKLTPTTPPLRATIVTATVNGGQSPEFVEEQDAD